MEKPPGMNERYWIAVAFAVIAGAAFLGAGTNDTGSNDGVFVAIGIALLAVAVLGFLWLLRTADLSTTGAKIGTTAFVLICAGAVLISISDGALSGLGYVVGGVGFAGWIYGLVESRKTKQVAA